MSVLSVAVTSLTGWSGPAGGLNVGPPRCAGAVCADTDGNAAAATIPARCNTLRRVKREESAKGSCSLSSFAMMIAS